MRTVCLRGFRSCCIRDDSHSPIHVGISLPQGMVQILFRTQWFRVSHRFQVHGLHLCSSHTPVESSRMCI